jgi:hypothetical protein
MREKILQDHPENNQMVFLEGFDDAIIGTALSQGNTVVCYSISRMIDNLKQNHEMEYTEALEWLDFNTLYAYFGEHTPVYVEDHGV